MQLTAEQTNIQKQGPKQEKAPKSDLLFYRSEVLENIGGYLGIKDLLSTATLSKEYHSLLRRYLKEQYGLTNDQSQNEFKQLKSLYFQKLFVSNKLGAVHPHRSNVLLQSIDCQERFSIIETIDGQIRVARSEPLLSGNGLELLPLPERYDIVKLAEGSALYCAKGSRLIRHRLVEHYFSNPSEIKFQGTIEQIVCGVKNAIVLVRSKPDQLQIHIFDHAESLNAGKQAQIPFELPQLSKKDTIAVGKSNCYLIYNEVLYDINLRTGSTSVFAGLEGHKIVRVIGGRLHFFAFERERELSSNWSTQEVCRFAQKEGLEDYIKIFRAEKVTGRQLLDMDKKYTEEVLGLVNVKLQQKLAIKLAENDRDNPEEHILWGWGRASEGALGTNPSKEITQPIKIKLPVEYEVHSLSGNSTFLKHIKNGAILINTIEQKTNRHEWKQIIKRKVTCISACGAGLAVVAAGGKDRVSQRESEHAVVEKKEKLRTAKNIIDKITWDENINSEEFRVGYLDKYDGVLEMPFAELQQSEIKQYRIEYFKRGNVVVWDKKKRIDVL